MDSYSNNDYRYYLEHSGRLGQKWGVRHGPPYPLGERQLTGAYKKNGGISKSAAKRDGVQRGSRSTKGLYLEDKPFIKSDYAVTNAKQRDYESLRSDTYDEQHYDLFNRGRRALDKAIGKIGNSIIDNEKLPKVAKDIMYAINPRLYTRYQNNDENFRNVEWQAVEERTNALGGKEFFNTAEVLMADPNNKELRKDTYELSSKNLNNILQDVVDVNPDFKTGDFGAQNNCPFCSATFAMRLKGYNVSARMSDVGSDSRSYNYWFKNAKNEFNVSVKDANKMFKDMKGGSYGTLSFNGTDDWGDEYGHVINFLKTTDNKMMFLDCQIAANGIGKITSLSELNKAYDITTSLGYDICDLTDATPNLRHMAKDTVITSPAGSSTVRYRNKYSHKVADVYDKEGRKYGL